MVGWEGLVEFFFFFFVVKKLFKANGVKLKKNSKRGLGEGGEREKVFFRSFLCIFLVHSQFRLRRLIDTEP